MAGRLADEVRDNLPGDSGMYVVSYGNRDEAAAYLNDNLRDGDMVMLKGSRGMKLDGIVKRLLDR